MKRRAVARPSPIEVRLHYNAASYKHPVTTQQRLAINPSGRSIADWGKPFVVDNRTGAGGIIGTEIAAAGIKAE